MRVARTSWWRPFVLIVALGIPAIALGQDGPSDPSGDASVQPTAGPSDGSFVTEAPGTSPSAVTRASQSGGASNFCETVELGLSRSLALQSEEVAWRATGLLPGSRVSPRAVDVVAATGASVTQLGQAVVGNQCDVSSTFLASDLGPGTYSLSVIGTAASGSSVEIGATFTIVASSRPPAPTATPRPLPNAPGGLRAVAISPNTIRLDWTDNSNNELGFRIDSEAGQFRPAANVTTYNVGGVTGSTAYCFSIYAYNDAGESFGGTSCAFTPSSR